MAKYRSCHTASYLPHAYRLALFNYCQLVICLFRHQGSVVRPPKLDAPSPGAADGRDERKAARGPTPATREGHPDPAGAVYEDPRL